jgi:prepilin-type N-terminal cleavage/methylation domain-containing protein
MKRHSRAGFTIIEVLIAIIMLSIGVLALASSSGTITRMMDDGRAKTDVAAVAQTVLDSLRFAAYGSSWPACSTPSNGSSTNSPRTGFATSWAVTGDPTSQLNLKVVVAYRTGRGTRTDSVMTTIYCR